MSILKDVPSWYCLLAIVFSSYYAYRGFRGCWIGFARTNEEIRKQNGRQYSTNEIVSIYCVHDMLFHLICSLAGFFTLLIANNLYEFLVSSQIFDTGKSVLLVFSFVFGIIGVTDQLPVLIPQGKLLSLKS